MKATSDEYMLLPLDANGVPLHVGDHIVWCGRVIRVSGVTPEGVIVFGDGLPYYEAGCMVRHATKKEREGAKAWNRRAE